MLTAHAMNPENVKKSYEQGAALYIPKDKLYQIELFLQDVLEAKRIKKAHGGDGVHDSSHFSKKNPNRLE